MVMITALQGLGKFVDFVRLTLRLYMPIVVVEPAVQLSFLCGGWEMRSGKNNVGYYSK